MSTKTTMFKLAVQTFAIPVAIAVFVPIQKQLKKQNVSQYLSCIIALLSKTAKIIYEKRNPCIDFMVTTPKNP